MYEMKPWVKGPDVLARGPVMAAITPILYGSFDPDDAPLQAGSAPVNASNGAMTELIIQVRFFKFDILL